MKSGLNAKTAAQYAFSTKQPGCEDQTQEETPAPAQEENIDINTLKANHLSSFLELVRALERELPLEENLCIKASSGKNMVIYDWEHEGQSLLKEREHYNPITKQTHSCRLQGSPDLLIFTIHTQPKEHDSEKKCVRPMQTMGLTILTSTLTGEERLEFMFYICGAILPEGKPSDYSGYTSSWNDLLGSFALCLGAAFPNQAEQIDTIIDQYKENIPSTGITPDHNGDTIELA